MEEWMMDGCVPESVAMPSRSKWAYEVETWGGGGAEAFWSGGLGEAQSKSQARDSPSDKLASCLYVPLLQPIFAYYGSPNQSDVPSYSRYLARH